MTCEASPSTSIWPSSVETSWPAMRADQGAAAERQEAAPIEAVESAHRRPYFFTVTVSFIVVGWIVQMNL